MKYSVLLAFFLFEISSALFAQCNASMAGTFSQSDSCTGYPGYQPGTKTIVASGNSDIIIQSFSELFPPYDATVNLDCANHTATIPFQTAGMTNISGSGSFSSDFNTMTLHYTVDFGISSINCTGIYTRQGTIGINEIPALPVISISPNPVTDQLIIHLSSLNSALQMNVYNLIGATVLSSSIISTTQRIDLSFLPSGMYAVQLKDNYSSYMQKILKQ